MNANNGTRIWQWAVSLLVLCNLGLVIILWLKPNREGPPRGGGPRDQVISDLKFTDDQIKKYDALIQEHQQAMRQLRNEGTTLREQLFSNLKGQPGNLSDSLAQAIGNNQKAIELATFNHFLKVRGLCTEQQKEIFDKIIVGITRNMVGNPGERPPPRRNQPGRPNDGPSPPSDKPGPPPPGDGDGPPPLPDGH